MTHFGTWEVRHFFRLGFSSAIQVLGPIISCWNFRILLSVSLCWSFISLLISSKQLYWAPWPCFECLRLCYLSCPAEKAPTLLRRTSYYHFSSWIAFELLRNALEIRMNGGLVRDWNTWYAFEATILQYLSMWPWLNKYWMARFGGMRKMQGCAKILSCTGNMGSSYLTKYLWGYGYDPSWFVGFLGIEYDLSLFFRNYASMWCGIPKLRGSNRWFTYYWRILSPYYCRSIDCGFDG